MKTSRRHFLIRSVTALSLCLAVASTFAAQERAEASTPGAAADSGVQQDRLAWFREARFGMFIHWGPYSELAGEWNGQRVKLGRNAEWIMHFLKIPAPEYRELARKSDPVKFDAEECIRLAKAAGMRYLVFTAKHHDGFAMYHSKVNILYLHVFKRPADGTLELPGLRSQVKQAFLLTDPGKNLKSSRSGSSVQISLPSIPADSIKTVVALELDESPRVDPPVFAEKAGKPVVLDYVKAVTSGNAVKRLNRRGQFHISKWTDPSDQATWRVRFLEPGRYRVQLVCAGAFGRPTGTFVLAAGDQKVEVESPQASDWYKYVTLDAGVLEITAAGEQELVLRPARELGQDLMYFKSLKLERTP